MALPATVSPLTPADSDSPSQGASQLRGIKQYVVDVFGAPNNSAVTVAPFSFGTTGLLSINVAPFVVPCVLSGSPSMVLHINSQYSGIAFDVNGASVMSLSAAGARIEGTLGIGGGAQNTRFKIDFGNVGGDVYTSSATGTNTGGYMNVRPSSIANTSGTGDMWILGAGTASLNPTGTSTAGAALYLDAPNKGGAGTFLDMSTLYVSSTPTGGVANYAAHFATSGRVRVDGSLDLGSTGAALPSGRAGIYNSGGTTLTFVCGTSTFDWLNNTLGNLRMRLTDAGILSLGTSVVGGAAAGDMVLANNNYLRGLQLAGVNTSKLIGYDASNRIAIGADGNEILLGNAATSSGASAGDVVVATGSSIRWANNAGSTTLRGIDKDTSDNFHIAGAGGLVKMSSDTVIAGSSYLSIGANPASTGVARLANAGQINSRNAANDGDIAIANVNSSNRVELGQTATDVVPAADASQGFGITSKRWNSGSFAAYVETGTTPATTGILRIANANSLYSRNQANTSDILMIGTDSTNMILVGTGSTNIIRMGGKVRCDLDTLSRFVLPVGTDKYAV